MAYKRWTHAFRPAKCLIEWPHVPEWEVKPQTSEKELHEILSQPFSYLGKGAQSYVFASQDQKYVLKLFRFDTCKAPFGQQFLRRMRKSLGLKEKPFLPTEVKIVNHFTSCKLAYTLAPKQTALVFVHLNPKKGLPIITLRDRLGRKFKIDPALYRFILQKKAKPFLKTLLAHKNDVQAYVDSYCQLLEELAAVGLVNLDETIGRNFGMIDDQAIQIDVGDFVYCPERAERAKAHFINSLNQWLKKRVPQK